MPRPTNSRITWWVGIDPGASGGIAAISAGGTVSAVPMPDTERDIYDTIAWYKGNWLKSAYVNAVIEMVTGYVGGAGEPGSAMFKFGTSYGGLRMALTAARIPFEAVMASSWQKALGIPKRDKSESKGQFKNRLKAKAQQLFPDTKVTLATSDALLLAEYCRRKSEGLI